MIRISKNKKEKIYNLLVEKCFCGPFDGCCLIYAEALQIKFGGEIYVIYSKDFTEHAALFLDNELIDFDGPLEPKKFIERFEKSEKCNKIIGYRKFKKIDLKDMYPDKKLSLQISKML
jgi:hypothetical protein